MDFSYLISISDGDKEFIREFISTFETNTALAISKMQAALESRDYDSLRKLAHQIKPSFEMLSMESHSISVKTQQNPETLKSSDIEVMHTECQQVVASMKETFNVY